MVTTGGVWLIGASGHGKVVIATLEAAGTSVAGLFDADPVKTGTTVLGHQVDRMPEPDWWTQQPRLTFLAVGVNEKRAKLAQSLSAQWATIIHPTAIVHPTVAIGPGTLVCAGAIIEPDVRIGAHAIINNGVIIEHDSVIGDYCHLAPGTRCSGAVAIGNGVLIGSGAVVIQGWKIGDDSVVGAGAVVIRSIPSRTVVAGVPARPISSSQHS
jgi:sugar O-acyltransferase (sialic acid O-acetyltransferase NeuD family)